MSADDVPGIRATRVTEWLASDIDVDYYRAFQYWRLASIVEGVLARYLKGVMGGKADTDAFRTQVDGLAGAALEMVRRMSP